MMCIGRNEPNCFTTEGPWRGKLPAMAPFSKQRRSQKVRRVTNSTGAAPHPPESCDVTVRERVQRR